ncbi:MAG TPA: nitrate- and nitrite sensing domain-containing protein [Candidatus Stackebrandtia excrementipullorum]|nr:nitrate- and nitrite sensing domain-containing protein [Candidatus Stackebrandtia excrementipullorum]
MRITQKLGVLVAVPLVAVAAFAALAVFTTGGEALQAERLRSLVITSASAGELIEQLRAERTAAATALAGGEEDAFAAYRDVALSTDVAVEAYVESRSELSDLPASTSELLNRIDLQLEGLDALRGSVLAADHTMSAAVFAYRITIADLLEYRDTVAQAGGASGEVADLLRGAAALSRAAEHLGLEQVAILRAIASGTLTSNVYRDFTAARTSSIESMITFNSLAPPHWQTWVEESLRVEDLNAGQHMEDQVARTAPQESIDFDMDEWNEAISVRGDGLLAAQSKIDADIVAEVTALRDSQRDLTILQTVAVFLVVAVAVTMAVWLGRPVVRGLRRMRDAAHRVAQKDLPEAVARFDDHEVLGELTPEQFADGMTPPVEVRGQDEIAEVGAAFNQVHREAVRVAAQQALLRVHIGAIFVNLARRGHSLTGRLTAALDEAERSELDPERLERLFALDHLVTLLARSNDSLLVLGGASPAKVRSGDEPVGGVLTAAGGQIEQYTRVDVGMVDEGVAIRADAVDDVVKLLAELMDNATRYSKPQIQVTARLLADRLIVQIKDEGIGMPPEQVDAINERLMARPPLDLEAVRSMGLTVVGHIAARRGIRVQLRPGQNGGTIAEVTVPAALLAEAPDKMGVKHRPIEPPKKAPLFQKSDRQKKRKPRPAIPPAPAAITENRPTTRESSHLDDTMEMPIVQFDWTDVDDSTSRIPRQRRSGAADPTRHRSGEPMQDRPDPASAQATLPPRAVPDGQLPTRVPMAQLVPGQITPNTTPQTGGEFRDPDAVGATYAAYARGLAAKRPASTDSNRSRATL